MRECVQIPPAHAHAQSALCSNNEWLPWRISGVGLKQDSPRRVGPQLRQRAPGRNCVLCSGSSTRDVGSSVRLGVRAQGLKSAEGEDKERISGLEAERTTHQQQAEELAAKLKQLQEDHGALDAKYLQLKVPPPRATDTVWHVRIDFWTNSIFFLARTGLSDRIKWNPGYPAFSEAGEAGVAQQKVQVTGRVLPGALTPVGRLFEFAEFA